MKYYVYIDESGKFDPPKEECFKSIVAGFITKLTPNKLQRKLENEILEFNKQNSTDFTLDDVHIAPLLHPDNTGTDYEKKRFCKIDISIRERFAQKCKSILIDISDTLICSSNKGFSFGEADRQTRYGEVLCAFISELISLLDNNEVESIKLYIAPRSKKCLPKEFDYKIYHQKMVQYINSWLKEDFPDCNIDVGFGSKHKIGFALADVACYYLRKKGIFNKNKVIYTEPNKSSSKKLIETNKKIVDIMLKKNEYFSAYNICDSIEYKEKILKKLLNADNVIKIYASEKLLNIAYSLIDKRTTKKGAINEANFLFKKLYYILQGLKVSEKQTSLLLSTVNGIMICTNHYGIKGYQKKMYDAYQEHMAQLTSIPYFTRKEKILAMRNRAYNEQFNNYDFENIINDFEPVVKERVCQLPKGEKDSLTGEMLGTIGQAYAFLSKNNKDFIEIADNYFVESMYHFIPGHKYHQMAVNYMTTHRWYHNNLKEAKEAFSENVEFKKNKSVSQWINAIINSKNYHLGSAFYISILIKMAVSQGKVALKALQNIETFLKKCDTKEHPYELIYKWLGIAYLKLDSFDKALKAFNNSILISESLGFTVETIALSTLALKYITQKRNNDVKSGTDTIEKLKKKFVSLTSQSTHFSYYMDSIGGVETLINDIEKENIDNIAKWLPFAYA